MNELQTVKNGPEEFETVRHWNSYRLFGLLLEELPQIDVVNRHHYNISIELGN